MLALVHGPSQCVVLHSLLSVQDTRQPSVCCSWHPVFRLLFCVLHATTSEDEWKGTKMTSFHSCPPRRRLVAWFGGMRPHLFMILNDPRLNAGAEFPGAPLAPSLARTVHAERQGRWGRIPPSRCPPSPTSIVSSHRCWLGDACGRIVPGFAILGASGTSFS